MFGKISSIITTRSSTPAPPLPASHHAPSRAVRYVDLASRLSEAGVPVDQSDCATCDLPCPPDSDAGTGPEVIWGGRSYEEYVLDRYGELGSLPEGIDTDWESELAGSATGGTGRVVVISTGKSDWERDHTVSLPPSVRLRDEADMGQDEKDGFAHQLYKHIQSLPPGTFARPEKEPYDPRPQPISAFILPASLPPPSTPTSSGQIRESPSLYSSSLISQSDNPSDQTVLVFPDWKVVHEVENSREGARGLYEGSLEGGLGRAGRVVGGKAEGQDGVGRRRSWVLPYRAVVLLCTSTQHSGKNSLTTSLLVLFVSATFSHPLIPDSRDYTFSIPSQT